MAKVASTTCHHYERERERLDGGQWTCERGQATCNTTGQKEAPLKPCSHHSSLHQQPPHHHTHHTSVVMVTHCLLTHTHTRAKAGQGAHHHQANGVDGLHSDHGVAQAWLWCGVAIKPCATRGGTHAIQVATCSPHCPTTTTTPVLSGVNTRATTSPHPSPRVCVCDCGTEPSTMPTSVVINHCVPCQSTTWSFIHHQSPPAAAAAQEQESVVTQMDEGMEAHTTHSVVESNTANQHTSTHTSGHTNTSQPPIHHTHTGWMAKGLIARTCEESEKTTPCK